MNSYLSNRISYALGLTGPSVTLDTACSSSAYALDYAYQSIMSGSSDAALVCGTQLNLNMKISTEYFRFDYHKDIKMNPIEFRVFEQTRCSCK